MEMLKPKPPWEKTGNLRVLSAYWWNDLPTDDWRRRVLTPDQDKRKQGHLLLHVEWASGTRLTSSQIARLLNFIDRNVHLVGNQGKRIPLEIRGSVWTGPQGGAELEIQISDEVYSMLKSDMEYSLEPVNSKEEFQWEVADGIKVVKKKGVRKKGSIWRFWSK